MNRYLALIGIYFILTVHLASAQQEIKVDSLIKNLRLDFAVPDLPAFNALQSDPGNLLRPSAPKEFSFIANEFFNGSNIIIPKSIAFEIAPIVLIRYNKLTLKDYQNSPVLYNTRVSVGTLRDSMNISRLSIGFRTTLMNKGDIKSDKNLKLVFDELQARNKGRNEYYDQELKKIGKGDLYFAQHPELQKKYDHEFDSIYSIYSSNPQNIKNHMENNCWNAEKLDIAFSFVGASPDSLLKRIKYNSFLAWLTYARPLGRNGQLLGGLFFNTYKDESTTFYDYSLQSRFYMGINQVKGFVEGQYLHKDSNKSNNIIARFGCEYNLKNGVWLDLNAGITNDLTNNTSDFISTFRFIYAIPGNIK
jgi:hypothetical protein